MSKQVSSGRVSSFQYGMCLRTQRGWYEKLFSSSGWPMLDVLALPVSSPQPEFTELVIVPPEVTIEKLIRKMQLVMRIDCVGFDSLTAGWSHARTANTCSYAVLLRRRIEADVENALLSPRQVWKRGIHGVTLIERLLFGWLRYCTMQHHLDQDSYTLCTGTQTSDGRVPGVCWDADRDRLLIELFDIDYRAFGIRAREVVAL